MSTATGAVLILLALTALWTIQTTILRAAIGLAMTSALISVVLFQMGAPLAAVFELSVCAGLITVVFAATIHMTRPLDEEGEARCEVRRQRRFSPLVLLVAAFGGLLWASGYALEVTAPAAVAAESSRDLLWSLRRLDVVGQLVILFVGVFGVVILFKERDEDEQEPEVSP